MEFKQLRYFVMLAKELHFQRAARLLCVTQPALSQQIKNLENKLEQSLFERDRQSVKLTPAGELLLDQVSPLLIQLEQALDKVRYLDKSAPSRLKISVASYASVRPVNKAFLRFKAQFPEVELSRIQAPTDQIQDLVREGQIDGGFTPTPVTHPVLVTKKVVEGTWSLVVPKSHSLAQTRSMPIAQVRDLPLIFFARELNPELHNWVLGQIRSAGGEPNVVMEATQVSSALEMVHDEIGCYLVVDYLIPEHEDVHIVRLSGFPHATKFSFIWHEDNVNPALQAFVTLLREAVEECR